MKLIIVPRWLEQTLAAHGLPLSAVTDVKKVLSITSAEDVSVYAMVNAWPLHVSGAVYMGCYEITEQALALQDARVSSYMSYLEMKLNPATEVNNPTQTQQFNPLEHLIGRNFVEGAPLCYSCTVLDDEYIVVTLGQHEVGTPNEVVRQAERLFKERLFGQHLLKHKLPELADKPVFINYLKGLVA